MKNHSFPSVLRRGLAILFAVPFLLPAETLLESSNEARFQLDVKVPDAALAAWLPQGWTSAPATQGAAKDCNLRVIFIDRKTINGPDGKPLGKGSNRYVLLAAPVKSPSGENVQMVIGGLTEDPADAPGPFGNFIKAKASMQWETKSNGLSPIIESQDWVFQAESGERLELHITYERGVAAVRPRADTKYYSAKNPSFYHISRQEQVLDIMRNVTTKPENHVKSFSFKGAGGSYAKLFGDSVESLSWDNVIWLNRSILLP